MNAAIQEPQSADLKETREEQLLRLLQSANEEVAESRGTIAMLAQQLADKREIIRKLTA